MFRLVETKTKISTLTTQLFGEYEERASELYELCEAGVLNDSIHVFIGHEVVRLQKELSTLLQLAELTKDSCYKTESLFQKIKLIEVQLNRYKKPINISDQLLNQLGPTIRKAKKIEVFVGFEQIDRPIEIPLLSYGVKFYLEDGSEVIHLFKSTGDGCLVSDIANSRRKRTLNTIVSIIDELIHSIFGEKFNGNIECIICTDIEIVGLNCPEIFTIVKNGNEVKHTLLGTF
ncbi:hypothetical protein [Paenibacillus sp. FSL L8-0709]|uniref:hypothetical protein n=1 Tax=Paenibacillus sp. FSL L8-0709 TaxID=2975312 RepID=UPI0030F893DB